MERVNIPNTEFLKSYLGNGRVLSNSVVLPHEGKAVDEALEKQRKAFENVVEQKIEVSGGDDWHDGAFRATDNEAKIIGQRMAGIAPFIGATVVDYPDNTEPRATLGSRVRLNQNGISFPVDIIGFRSGYPEDIEDESGEQVIGMSPESPLARLVIGSRRGDEHIFSQGDREVPVLIEMIDQNAVKNYFANNVQVLEITD